MAWRGSAGRGGAVLHVAGGVVRSAERFADVAVRPESHAGLELCPVAARTGCHALGVFTHSPGRFYSVTLQYIGD